MHFSGPALRSAVTSQTQDGSPAVTLTFDYASDGKMFLNDTLGCKEHRGYDFHGNEIGGECCAARDTFQLCAGSAARNNTNTTFMACANATSVTVEDNGVVVVAGTAPNGAVPTAVRHAYANYPQCALYNSYGLPASPFLSAVDAGSVAKTFDAKATRPFATTATPPMGVNSWNSFHCNVDERKMRGMANALVSTGLADVGYKFLNIDDWFVELQPWQHRLLMWERESSSFFSFFS